MMHFHAFADSQVLQTSAHRRMLNRRIYADVLDFRIRNSTVVFKKRRQPSACYEAGLVNSRRQHGTAMLPVPHGIVGAAAEKRDTKWSTCNYHLLAFPIIESSNAGQSRRVVRICTTLKATEATRHSPWGNLCALSRFYEPHREAKKQSHPPR